MNRDRIKINWKFDRKAARRKFGYKRNLSRGQRPRRLPRLGFHRLYAISARGCLCAP